MKEQIIPFLKKNGYKEESDKGGEYRSFFKGDLCAIDIGVDEIVFIDDTGDFLHLPLNYYALIGALIHFRQLSVNYKP